jgi:hypothetical protein
MLIREILGSHILTRNDDERPARRMIDGWDVGKISKNRYFLKKQKK